MLAAARAPAGGDGGEVGLAEFGQERGGQLVGAGRELVGAQAIVAAGPVVLAGGLGIGDQQRKPLGEAGIAGVLVVAPLLGDIGCQRIQADRLARLRVGEELAVVHQRHPQGRDGAAAGSSAQAISTGSPIRSPSETSSA